MTRAGLACLGSLLALLLLPAAASAASHRFVVLADSATEVKPNQYKAPSIDEDGAVAFIASSSMAFSYTGRLLVGSQPGAETFAEYTQVAASLTLSIGEDAQIGTFTNGKLAYFDYQENSGQQQSIIYRWDGGAPVPVRLVSGLSSDDGPAMSGSGEVVVYLHFEKSIVVTDGENTVEIANTNTVFADDTEIDNILRPAPDIDGVGRVAYFASIAAEGTICDDRILLSGLDPPLVLATGNGWVDLGCPFLSLSDAIPIALNDAGSAAFVGTLSIPDEWVDAIFVDGTVVWDIRVPGFAPLVFKPIKAVALNDTDTVAFLLQFDGGRGLYVGPDPIADRVIGTGDPLCGGVVQSIRFSRFGLNDAGELALAVELADSRRLIVRAEPTLSQPGACVTQVPEPALGGAAAGVALALLARRQDR